MLIKTGKVEILEIVKTEFDENMTKEEKDKILLTALDKTSKSKEIFTNNYEYQYE